MHDLRVFDARVYTVTGYSIPREPIRGRKIFLDFLLASSKIKSCTTFACDKELFYFNFNYFKKKGRERSTCVLTIKIKISMI